MNLQTFPRKKLRTDKLEPLQEQLQDLLDQLQDNENAKPDWNDYMPDHMKQEESEEEDGEGEGEGEGEADDTKDEYGNPKPGTPGGPQGEDETDEEYSDRMDREWEQERKERQERWDRERQEAKAEQQARELFEEDTAKNKEKEEEIQEQIDDVKKMHDFLDGEGQKSMTDDAYRENEQKLVDLEAQPLVYVKPQKMFKAKDWIVPMNELYNWEKSIEMYAEGYDYSTDGMPTDKLKVYANTKYKEFLSQTQPIINGMAQQFELKKAAVAHKKAQIAKTGS
jgi:hypothetical protein